MANQRLFVVHGMGNDAVGLVGRITAPIARVDGNILDLRQDVLHGLFTIYMVVDLTQSQLQADQLRSMVEDISRDTGLKIAVDPFAPVASGPEKKNLLMILIGRDRPGIIASSSEMLGKYNANIELAKTIGREGIFLMELLTDVSHIAIPLENLKRAIRGNMNALDIKAIFQDEQVFIKRKRIILFDISSSFIDRPTLREILQQAELGLEDLPASYARHTAPRALEDAAARLDGLPLDVIDTVLAAITPTPGSVELVQTLKMMGYRIALVSTGFTFFTDHVRKQLAIDYAFGTSQEVDDDARVLIGQLANGGSGGPDMQAVRISAAGVGEGGPGGHHHDIRRARRVAPGIRLQLDLEILLDCLNRRAISSENLIGLLGSFGIPERGDVA